MAQDTINIPEIAGGSAAANTPKSYSAKELAEVYLNTPVDFFGIDLEITTLNWNPNYIFDFLYHIRNIEEIELAIEIIKGKWIETYNVYASYDLTKDAELEQRRQEFEKMINYIKEKLTERINQEDKNKKLKEMILNRRHSVVTTTNGNEMPKPVATKVTSTQPPAFQTSSQNPREVNQVPLVKLEDLPENIRNKVIVSQKVFDVFVKQLNEDLWLTVMTNKTKFCGCLYFLCNFHYITSRDTKVDEFDELLHILVVSLKDEKSLVSSIHRRKETKQNTIDRSYKCYACADVNKNMEKEIFELRNDCKLLSDGFKPVIDAMKEDEIAANKLTVHAPLVV